MCYRLLSLTFFRHETGYYHYAVFLIDYIRRLLGPELDELLEFCLTGADDPLFCLFRDLERERDLSPSFLSTVTHTFGIVLPPFRLTRPSVGSVPCFDMGSHL